MDKKYCLYCMQESDADICPHCKKSRSEYVSAPHHLAPGTLLSGRYLIGRVLGEGGFGITYMGRDTFLDLRVAIKEFFPSGVVNRNATVSAEIATGVTNGGVELFEKGKTRFLSEARTLAKFSTDEHVVTVRDFFPANNTAYIVMDYLEGIDLNKFLKSNGPQSFPKTVEMLMPIIDVLEKVHGAGLIHRDISPSNIMILRTGKIILLDFGAARDYGSEEKSLSIMLKPGYAPQEQYGSKCQGPWTDVYALCATMYKLMTDKTPEDSMNRIMSDELEALENVNRSITHFQSAVIMRGMALNYKDRYQSMSMLKSALIAALNPAPSQQQQAQQAANVKTVYVQNPGRDASNPPKTQSTAAPGARPTEMPKQPPRQQYQAPPKANNNVYGGNPASFMMGNTKGGTKIYRILMRIFWILSLIVALGMTVGDFGYEDCIKRFVISLVFAVLAGVFVFLSFGSKSYKTKKGLKTETAVYSVLTIVFIIADIAVIASC